MDIGLLVFGSIAIPAAFIILGLYMMFLIIKALRIYIKNNS